MKLKLSYNYIFHVIFLSCSLSWPISGVEFTGDQVSYNQQFHLDTSTVRSSGSDVSYCYVQSSFQGLSLHALPQLPSNMIYAFDHQGKRQIYSVGTVQKPIEIRIYGPDMDGRFGFVTVGMDNKESFSVARYNQDHPKRSSHPIQYSEEGWSISHLIDLAHMANQSHNSNGDPQNYLMANRIYNQNIRRQLTNYAQNLGGSYGEISIYAEHPKYISQRIRLKPRQWSNWTPAIIPQGFIFKIVKPAELYFLLPSGQLISKPEDNHIYYFPNYCEGIDLNAYYQNLYNPAQNQYYIDVASRFEILNSSHLFKPLVYDYRQDYKKTHLDIYTTFFNGTNLLPFVSLSEMLELSKSLNLPFVWHGLRGITQAQRDIALAMLQRGEFLSIDEQGPYTTQWNNFQIPTEWNPQKGCDEWIDASTEDVPLIAKLIGGHKDLFLKYVGYRLLEEAAKHQLDSIQLKLALSDIYLKQKNPQKSFEWIYQAYLQNEALRGTLTDAIDVFKRYCNLCLFFTFDPNIQQYYVDILKNSLISRMSSAFLEERLEYNRFIQINQWIGLSPVKLNVKKIDSQNSSILKKKLLTSAHIVNLVELIEQSQELEEISLDGVRFYVSEAECWTSIDLGGDDNCDIDSITEEEYFWTYDQPLLKILKALKKTHSGSLRKLNLSNMSFNDQPARKNILEVYNSLKILDRERMVLDTSITPSSSLSSSVSSSSMPSVKPVAKKSKASPLHVSLSSLSGDDSTPREFAYRLRVNRSVDSAAILKALRMVFKGTSCTISSSEEYYEALDNIPATEQVIEIKITLSSTLSAKQVKEFIDKANDHVQKNFGAEPYGLSQE